MCSVSVLLECLHLLSASEALQASAACIHPLSTLLQLEEQVLSDEACSATSLHGLAELSRLKALTLDAPMLNSLEGVSPILTSLVISNAQGLQAWRKLSTAGAAGAFYAGLR